MKESHNSDVSINIMSAVVLCDFLISSWWYQPELRMGDAKYYVDASAFRIGVFMSSGWVFSFTRLDDSKCTFLIGSIGLIMWIIGHVLFATMGSYENHNTMAFIDSLLVTAGGSIFYWYARTSSNIRQDLLSAMYLLVAMPTDMMTSSKFVLVASICPLLLYGMSSLKNNNTRGQHEETTLFGKKTSILVGINVVCAGYCGYTAFLCLLPYMTHHSFDKTSVYTVSTLTAFGYVCGHLVSYKFGRIVSILMRIVQTVVLAVWAATTPTMVSEMGAIGFFTGFAMSDVLYPYLSPSPVDLVFYMTCITPGSWLMVHTFREFTNFGAIDFHGVLSVGAGVSSASIVVTAALIWCS